MRFNLDFYRVTRPWRRALTNGSDVEYVFPRCRAGAVNHATYLGFGLKRSEDVSEDLAAGPHLLLLRQVMLKVAHEHGQEDFPRICEKKKKTKTRRFQSRFKLQRWGVCKRSSVNLYDSSTDIISTDNDCCDFSTKIFGKLPKNTISRNCLNSE